MNYTEADICLLVTATVDPKGMKFLVRNDVNVRLNDYKKTFLNILNNYKINKIIFIENSGFNISIFKEIAKKYPIVILFLDELTSAAPAVQAATYQLILNRRIGKYVLPDNVVLVAAGNRESDKGVSYRMPTPLANRFIHQ